MKVSRRPKKCSGSVAAAAAAGCCPSELLALALALTLADATHRKSHRQHTLVRKDPARHSLDTVAHSSSAAMAPFAISPVTPDDLPAIGDITTLTFCWNPQTLSYHIFAHVHEADVAAWSLRSTQFTYHNSPGAHFTKLVDTANGEIVAFSLWQLPKPVADQDELARWKQEMRELGERRKKEVRLPPATNELMLFSFEEKQDKLREKHVDPTKDYVLKMLAVSPKYQGEGCASMLLQTGLATVDDAGAKVWLEATPLAKPIYERYAWREVEAIESEVEGDSGPRIHVTCGMMRTSQGAAL